jgi:hypothetical protein
VFSWRDYRNISMEYISIKKTESGFECFDNTDYTKGKELVDLGFNLAGTMLDHIKPLSLNDINSIDEDFEPYMQFGNQHFFIKTSYKLFLEEQKSQNLAKLNKQIDEHNLAIKKELEEAYIDSSGMIEPNFAVEYSRSKRVTQKMKNLLSVCWDKTQSGISNFEIRDFFLEQFSAILNNLPSKAVFDYSDKWNERQEFWNNFPPSWKIIFEAKYEIK